MPMKRPTGVKTPDYVELKQDITSVYNTLGERINAMKIALEEEVPEIAVKTLYVGEGGITLDERAVIMWDNLSGVPEGLLTQTDLVTALSDYVTTGYLTTELADTITTGNFSTIITKDYIASMNLIVGQEILMGANARIAWLNIDDSPNTTYIDANGIYTGVVAADKISAGMITGCTMRTAASGARVVLNAQNVECYYDASTAVKMGYWGSGAYPYLQFTNSSSGKGVLYKTNTLFVVGANDIAGNPCVEMDAVSGVLNLHATSVTANSSQVLTANSTITAKFA